MTEERSGERRMRGGVSALGCLLGWVLVPFLVVSGTSKAAEGEEPVKVDWEAQRIRMVETQIEARGVRDARVLEAMRTVPRHEFMPESVRRYAYADEALPIGQDQTISQPYVVAAMTEALAPEAGDKILEVGTGSGYQAAVLSRLVKRLHTIEIIPELAERARTTLKEQRCENVTVITGDGYGGLPSEAPFDGIIVTAAPREVPQPLLDQLAVGGRLVIPVGSWFQELKVLEKTQEGIESETLFGVRFVPLVRGDSR